MALQGAAGGLFGEESQADPFADFLQQDAAQAPVQTTYAQPTYAQPTVGEEVDASTQLRMLVEVSLRQEQLLGKVCSLLVGLDEKVNRIAANQERLEATLATAVSQGGGIGAGGAAKAGQGSLTTPGRGTIVMPPGKPGAPGGPIGGGYSAQSSSNAAAEEQARLNAERMAVERLRIEEEGRRRAEELARKREEDERRRREEAERQRLEEDRKREEERQRKEALERKTTGLMSNLIQGGGGGLFGDEDLPKKPKKGGLFDDD